MCPNMPCVAAIESHVSHMNHAYERLMSHTRTPVVSRLERQDA